MGLMYKLTFENGKSYVGITAKTLARRLSLHRSQAKKGRPGALQNALRKYGFHAFKSEVLFESENWEELCKAERQGILDHKTRAPDGYNLTNGGEGNIGYKPTDETRKKMSAAQKGIKRGPSKMKGTKRPEDVRQKIIAGLIGRPVSVETRKKLGAAKLGNTFNVGRACKEETKIKISAAQKGKPKSEAARMAMIGVKKGRPWSDARRAAHERGKNGIDTFA